MLIPTSHECHQSEDGDGKDYFDQENPSDKKKSPYWSLSENSIESMRVLACTTKKTANKRQKNVSIYGQTVQEADWIKEQVQQSAATFSSSSSLG